MSSSSLLSTPDGFTVEADVAADAWPVAPLTADLALAVDLETLLPGEDPESTDQAEAVRWVRVYRDLIELTTVLLERTESALKQMADDAVQEAGVDQRLLRTQRERYLARYDFWVARVESA